MNLSDSFKVIYSILQDISNAPNGISTGEISKKYNVSRRIIPKYIEILEKTGVPIYYENKRYYVDVSFRTSFVLTPEESDFLVLMMERALITQTIRSKTVYRLFRRLGERTTGQSPNFLTRLFPVNIVDSTEFDGIFSILSQARRENREVWVEYIPLRRDEPTKWLIRPFRFANNPLSDGFYVMCEGTQDGKTYVRLNLKFDRILQAQPSNIHYQTPDKAIFENPGSIVWGMWSGNKPPVTVKLRFEHKHYARLHESVWHMTQRIFEDSSDGYVYFFVDVSEPEEMVPWIRSWGAGVVVLEPERLRQRLIQSILRQAMAYQLVLAPNSSLSDEVTIYQLWAKYESRSGLSHSLIYHMLDVASVAIQLWENVLSNNQRAWLCNCLKMTIEQSKLWLAMIVGLHDIGKATPVFQAKVPILYQQLEQKRFNHPDTPHGILSAVILSKWLLDKKIDPMFSWAIGSGIGGHHGSWVKQSDYRSASSRVGDETWKNWQSQLIKMIESTLGIEEFVIEVTDTRLINLFVTFLSGFTSVCDWIGSNSDYFPYEATYIKPKTYFEESLKRAEEALLQLRFFNRIPYSENAVPSFRQLFGFEANLLQQSVLALYAQFQMPPKLILIEYPTGSGKTEIALYLADLLIQKLNLAGFYVAMPTQATSNQMFSRVVRFLEIRYPYLALNVQLAHGDAESHPLYKMMPLRHQSDLSAEQEGNLSNLESPYWFRGTKRALLAPYAVGTVDQAMLSVMQVKHHFVRQYALSQKVIIFDEIHSYDAYMNAIIERLMGWLSDLQSPLILLSATLSHSIRQTLINQVAPNQMLTEEMPYPRLTVVHADNHLNSYSLPAPESRTIQLHFVEKDETSLWSYLAPVYVAGGCIAIICNTVDETIALANFILAQSEVVREDVIVFHARFPKRFRLKREKSVINAFGKHGERPQRAILIATQIIEQSLDLDFDCMVTSVAPIDLLVQRAGRLHRHHRIRLPHLSTPVLIVRKPELRDDVAYFGRDEFIYQRLLLLKTWLILRERQQLVIPSDLDSVMNFVYSDQDITEGLSNTYVKALQESRQIMTSGESGAIFRGTQYLISVSTDELLFGQSNLLLDEGERAKTRDFLPSIEIACLFAEEAYVLEKRILSPNEVSEIRQSCITIHAQAIVSILLEIEVPSAWKSVPSLREVRPIILDSEMTFRLLGGQYTLRLSKKLGLEIINEKERNV